MKIITNNRRTKKAIALIDILLCSFIVSIIFGSLSFYLQQSNEHSKSKPITTLANKNNQNKIDVPSSLKDKQVESF